eukprot:3093272-Alexandrium_andersonii.AAC.1
MWESRLGGFFRLGGRLRSVRRQPASQPKPSKGKEYPRSTYRTRNDNFIRDRTEECVVLTEPHTANQGQRGSCSGILAGFGRLGGRFRSLR